MTARPDADVHRRAATDPLRIAVSALAIAVIVWQLSMLGLTLAREGSLADASSYQAAVERWLSGESPYSAEQLSGPHTLGSAVGGSGFVYPPIALPLFLPLALGFQATLAWVLLTHAAFLVVVFAIARRELGEQWPVAGALAFVAAALSLPGLAEITLGNASALIAALIGLAWLIPRHAAVFGLLAGAIKVFPLLAVPWAKSWRAAWAPAAAVAGVFGVISLIPSPERWVEWVTAMTTAIPSCPTWALTSLPCATGSSLRCFALAAVLGIGALLAPTRTIGFFILTVAMIVPAPDLYQHYLLVPFVGALPLACLGLRSLATLAAERRAAGIEAAPS